MQAIFVYKSADGEVAVNATVLDHKYQKPGTWINPATFLPSPSPTMFATYIVRRLTFRIQLTSNDLHQTFLRGIAQTLHAQASLVAKGEPPHICLKMEIEGQSIDLFVHDDALYNAYNLKR